MVPDQIIMTTMESSLIIGFCQQVFSTGLTFRMPSGTAGRSACNVQGLGWGRAGNMGTHRIIEGIQWCSYRC